jgi:hypothetical protein
MFSMETQYSGGKLHPFWISVVGGGEFLEEISCGRSYSTKEWEQKHQEHHSFRIGMWNITAWNQSGKLKNLKEGAAEDHNVCSRC